LRDWERPVSDATQPALSSSDRFRADLTAGFLVFLIALPLCLAISLASGFPATAGVFTAIVGGLVAPWISNSELTIKGPAAGLIVIVLGCVLEFGGGPEADAAASYQAYRLALGVGVVAGILQVGLALVRSGILSELFPLTVVHGMLAAIGVIIMSKQVHLLLGVKPHGQEPLELIAEIPRSLANLNPEIAFIGVSNLLLLFLWPLLKNANLRRIPAQLVVVLVGIPLAYYFDLDHAHSYTFGGHSYDVGEQFLVAVPGSIIQAVATPDFGGLATWTGWKWVLMFLLIGTLESLLSAKAIDLLDPQRRKTDVNRDLLAVGVGNTLAACLGGLPMISEIVRSKANIDNGAQSRYANLFHGIFLLLFVALLPGLIHRIPLASLAAMLVFTGFRLAHPREFLHMYKVGPEQLLIFSATLFGVLATDLLIGVGIGIAVKLALHCYHGVSVQSFVSPGLETDEPDEFTTRIRVRNAAVFSTWVALRKQILGIDAERAVILDLSPTRFVDHTVMEKLHDLQQDFLHEGRYLLVVGLKEHLSLSSHPQSARRKPRAVPNPVDAPHRA
jgi:MFS superfamily sulfate permease-like transporter